MNARREAAGEPRAEASILGPKWEFENFLSASNWYLYRRIDSPGSGIRTIRNSVPI